ncbi:uncharacterized protein N7473_006732 [Penicillium subrubescens]|uniref:uncharacterized protein n=1 Tax=Penicillium subrubescens TaxID=1316194 RepID=UPI0025455EBA|nr:uncharacterized protein N7473_006732 [Penicillium subrubescens]KAJ5890504.1 hypothetical protein N7473_006732 [Penicillium subrubescens]
MTDVPWDGSYPWRKSALKRTMPNGDEFTTVIDPSVPDSDTQIAGLAGLGLNRTVFSVVVTTNVAFTLLMMVQNAHPLILNKNEVKLPNPNDVFHIVYNAIEGNGCRTSSFDVGNSCTISYRCMFAGETNVIKPSSDAVAKSLHGTAGLQVAKSWYEKTTYSSQWGIPKYWIGCKYPRNGQIVITQDNSVQSQLSFEITCKGSWFCDVACSGVTAGMLSLGSAAGLAPAEVFGALTAGACGAFC